MKKCTFSLKQVLIEYILVIGGILLLENWMIGFHNIDFKIPIVLDGGDGYALIADIKKIIDGDGYRLGWPVAQQNSQYEAVFNALFIIYIRFLSLFTKNYYLIQNVYYCSLIFLNCIVSYVCFRQMKIRNYLSFFGCILFGISPYVQFRLTLHACLASVEMIPVVFLMSFWLMEDDKYAVPNKNFFKYKKNIIQIFLSWCIANNGIVYYPFFSCFLLLITGLYLALSTKQKQKLASAFVVIGQIVFFLGLGFIPTAIGILNGVGNVTAKGANYRDARRAVAYGLDFKTMFLSPKGFGIPGLKEIYKYFLVQDSEICYAYIGMAGIVGLVILLWHLLINKELNSTEQKRIKLLSVQSVFIILLGIRNGIGVLVALFIPMISCYNRVNPFIVCASVIAFLLVLEKSIKSQKTKRKKYRIIIGSVLFMIYAIVEQRGAYCLLPSTLTFENEQRLISEKSFFTNMEQLAGEGAKVFVLPYMSSFESDWIGDLVDYEHYRPYINTETLCFSYGGINHGENDVWYETTSQLDVPDMINELKDKGFSGIYINIKGFEERIREQYLSEIIEQSGASEIVCDELGELWYIPISQRCSDAI